ncbi:hypothetical protein N7462_000378 [Penicillium macrosclerotiorum]|uniref:uncharacterized protein n=1 Tax=Penicillium macrosclerotiorum TaxID=303699 RepID=UPI00254726F5|nr:uncharacterized protein N7462_000378 [Penicillium macrosclerotiorum]KAJ5698373.1 hypothetical protein N7462_000378 [Penicillium macrosclerotiorum]
MQASPRRRPPGWAFDFSPTSAPNAYVTLDTLDTLDTLHLYRFAHWWESTRPEREGDGKEDRKEAMTRSIEITAGIDDGPSGTVTLMGISKGATPSSS